MPPLPTGAVALVVSDCLRITPPLTERQLNQIVRRAPTLRPPVVAGRRQWATEHVEQLITLLRARTPSHKSK